MSVRDRLAEARVLLWLGAIVGGFLLVLAMLGPLVLYLLAREHRAVLRNRREQEVARAGP